MELPDGQRIQQTKETLSTFSAIAEFPQKSVSGLEPQAQQTGFQDETGSKDQRRVVRAGGFRQN